LLGFSPPQDPGEITTLAVRLGMGDPAELSILLRRGASKTFTVISGKFPEIFRTWMVIACDPGAGCGPNKKGGEQG
jgi:hypothetical protein